MIIALSILLSIIGVLAVATSITYQIITWMPVWFKIGITQNQRRYDIINAMGLACLAVSIILGFTTGWKFGLANLLAVIFMPKRFVYIQLFNVYSRGTKSGEIAYLLYSKQIDPRSTSLPSFDILTPGGGDSPREIARDREIINKIMRDEKLA